MKKALVIIFLILFVGFIASAIFSGSQKSHLHGIVESSTDGKTYLSVVNNNNGNCQSVLVDSKPWPHKLKELGPITPGLHTINCGGEIAFKIEAGTILHFEHWRP